MSTQPRTLLAPPTQQAKDAARELVRNPHATPVVAGNPTLQTAVERVQEGFSDYEVGVFARTLRGPARSIEAMELAIAQKISSEEIKVSVGIPSPRDLARALIADPSRVPAVEEGDLRTGLQRVIDGFSEKERGEITSAAAQPADSLSRVALELALGKRIGEMEQTVFFESIDAEVGLGG